MYRLCKRLYMLATSSSQPASQRRNQRSSQGGASKESQGQEWHLYFKTPEFPAEWHPSRQGGRKNRRVNDQ